MNTFIYILAACVGGPIGFSFGITFPGTPGERKLVAALFAIAGAAGGVLAAIALGVGR